MTRQVETIDQTLCPRRAGQLTRYHTWPRLREQSVGEHTWQLIRIILALWPEAPGELVTYAMFHDLGEVVTGDPPYPVKANNPVLKVVMDQLDAKACVKMTQAFMVPAQPHQVPEVLGPGNLTHTFFKLCELVEMWEWGLHERNLGNRYAALVAQRCWAAATRLRDTLAEASYEDTDLREIVTRYDRYVTLRAGYETEVADAADPFM